MSAERVLIIGGGISGMETALKLACSDFPCVLVEKTGTLGGILTELHEFRDMVDEYREKVEKHPFIDLQTETEPVKIRGVCGDFGVILRNGDCDRKETFSRIVFCTGVDVCFPNSQYPALANTDTRTLLELEKIRASGDLSEINTRGRALFVLGFSAHSYPFSMKNALKNALHLRQAAGMDVLVITDTVRFDDAWITDLYRQCREEGILFVKSVEPPEITADDKGYRFKVPDTSLASPGKPVFITGSASLVVLEPDYCPLTFGDIFWSPHDLDMENAGFYGDGNLHLQKVLSGRAGIYLTGSVTGIKDILDCLSEAALTVSHIMTPEPDHPHATVDEHKCASCLTCVRLCPHHAITIDRVAQIAEAACYGCGTCIAECPADAIRFDQETGRPETVAATSGIVVYCCDGSTLPAMQAALANGPVTEMPLQVRRLPCNGNLSVLDIIDVFKDGFNGIFVAACQDENCKHLHGNRRAARRVERARAILTELGMQPELVQIKHFASNMSQRLAEAIRSFEKETSAWKMNLNRS